VRANSSATTDESPRKSSTAPSTGSASAAEDEFSPRHRRACVFQVGGPVRQPPFGITWSGVVEEKVIHGDDLIYKPAVAAAGTLDQNSRPINGE
jgi:hypothetical protein